MILSCNPSSNFNPTHARAYDVELINDQTLEKRSYKGVTDFPLDHIASDLNQWVAHHEPDIPGSLNDEQIAGIVSALRETYNSGVYDSGKHSRAWKIELGNLIALMMRIQGSHATLFALTPAEIDLLRFLVTDYCDGSPTNWVISKGLRKKFADVIGDESE